MSNGSLLFAAAAAAAVWWFSRQPGAATALPPLSPLPAPLVPPAGPVAGGFNYPVIPWLIVAALLWMHLQDRPAPQPAPAPAPVVGLDLRGRFVGPEAAAGAATMAALLGELADVIAWDGQQTEPRLKTGAAIDDLRRTAREMRCRGVSLGARQPAVRDAIKAFLEAQVGTDGGPVDAAQRAKWVSAFRAVAQAAAEASR